MAAVQKILFWIKLSRPATLWISFAPVLLGTGLAYYDGFFNLWAALSALMGAIFIQIGTNLANDYYDHMRGADTDDRLGNIRAVQKGEISAETLKRAFIWAFLLAMIFSVYIVVRGGAPIVAIGVVSILFGVLYTGGPYPLAYNAVADVFVFIFFGLVAVGGTYYVQALHWSPLSFWVGCVPGLLATAVLTVNNIRDLKTDQQVGKRTLVGVLGESKGKLYYSLLIVAAFLLPLICTILYHTTESVYAVFALLPLGYLCIKDCWQKSSAELNSLLGRTVLLLLTYSLVFSCALFYAV